jgi:hypothetical protein
MSADYSVGRAPYILRSAIIDQRRCEVPAAWKATANVFVRALSMSFEFTVRAPFFRALYWTKPYSRAPRRASAEMWSPMRHASAWIVREGFAPPPVGNNDPSQIHRFGMSQLRP